MVKKVGGGERGNYYTLTQKIIIRIAENQTKKNPLRIGGRGKKFNPQIQSCKWE